MCELISGLRVSRWSLSLPQYHTGRLMTEAFPYALESGRAHPPSSFFFRIVLDISPRVSAAGPARHASCTRPPAVWRPQKEAHGHPLPLSASLRGLSCPSPIGRELDVPQSFPAQIPDTQHPLPTVNGFHWGSSRQRQRKKSPAFSRSEREVRASITGRALPDSDRRPHQTPRSRDEPRSAGL